MTDSNMIIRVSGINVENDLTFYSILSDHGFSGSGSFVESTVWEDADNSNCPHARALIAALVIEGFDVRVEPYNFN